MEKKVQKDDELFLALQKKKRQRRARVILTVVTIILVAAVALFLFVRNMTEKVKAEYGTSGANVKSYVAQVGTITTNVSGSGTIVNQDEQTLTVPQGVEVDKVLVAEGDRVAAGDIVATVKLSSVRSALADCQSELDDLDEQLEEAKKDAVETTMRSAVTGRVKIIYAQKGDSVISCMTEHGALAVLSMDGYLAVDIEAGELSQGDSVKVAFEDGRKRDGKVDTVFNDKATVLVTDDGPKVDDVVTILDAEGNEVGSGSLYIHQSLNVTGFAGTIDVVRIVENEKLYEGGRFFTLKDTGYTANYDSILRQRAEKEKTLQELLKLLQSGAIVSPIDGSVSVVDFNASETPAVSSASAVSAAASLYSAPSSAKKDDNAVVTICPDQTVSVTVTVDEANILALKLDQNADVIVSSISEDVLNGTVTEINRQGTYSAVVVLDKTEQMLPGMTAKVDIKIQGKEGTILIPVDALHETSTGAYVYTGYDPETEEYSGKVDVTAGLSNSNFVEIISGLTEGQTVYYTEKKTFDWSQFGMGGFRQ